MGGRIMASVQDKIQLCIKEVLGRTITDNRANLFEEGLTSISAMKFLVLLSKKLEKNITMQELKACSSIRELENCLMKKKEDSTVWKELDCYPIARTQLGILAECIGKPNGLQYNLPYLIRFQEHIDMKRLAKACEEVIEAHPYLKMVMEQNGQGDFVARKRKEKALPVKIYNQLPDKTRLVRSFQLLEAPLYRLELYEWQEEQYIFFDFHHIIFDGASMEIFLEDLERAYKGMELEPEGVDGFQIALQEEQLRKTDRYAKAKAYFSQLCKGRETNDLPLAVPEQEKAGVGIRKRKISLLKECTELEKKYGITLQALFMTGFGYLLSKYKYSKTAVFTTIYNGRSDPRMERTIDMLVKTFPMVLSFPEEKSVIMACKETKEQYLLHIEHDLYSFEEISQEYGIKSDIIFGYQGKAPDVSRVAGKRSEQIELNSYSAIAPVCFNVFLLEDGFSCVLEYEKERYSDGWADWFLESYEKVISEFLVREYLKDVTYLTERGTTFLKSCNDTAYPVKQMTANEKLEQVVEAVPDKIAVICGNDKRTYKELNENANRIAFGLRKAGVCEEQIVALMLPRSVSVYEARQGILKAGAAFLYVAPDYAKERVRYILEDSKAACLITTKELAIQRQDLWDSLNTKIITLESLLMTECVQNPKPSIMPENLAYCIYTSGSTGKPKGVAISHKNLINYVDFNKKNDAVYAYLKNTTCSLAIASFAFDASIMEECVNLYNGKTVCIATEEEIHNPFALAKLIEEKRIGAMFGTPAFLGALVELPEFYQAFRQIKVFYVGGEVFVPALLERIHRINADAVVINGYGPTETTIACTGMVLEDGDAITIGTPLTNTEIYIVDQNNHMLPPFIPGELLIAGEGVGDGYIGLPEVTREKFITFQGKKAYRSGDLAYWRGDGKIAYLRRMDQQVKLRGLRVELGEIESVMMQFQGIKECIVMVWGEGMSQYLCGYFTASEPVSKAALTEHLRQYVTDYMIPARLIQLEEFPLTVNGKIDKKALKEPDDEQQEVKGEKPKTGLEETLCRIFAMALARNEIAVEDDFFELGGTSLLASKVVMKCMSEGLPVVYADIFRYKTVLALEAVILERQFQSQAVEDRKWEKTQPYTVQKFDSILSRNCITEEMDRKKEPIGNVLITGTTGFLGMHVLKAYLEEKKGKAFCLVRCKKESAKARLEKRSKYYFPVEFMEQYAERVVVLEGDLTKEEHVKRLAQYDFDTVINCAACVKHFVHDEELNQVNAQGTEYLVTLCKKTNRKLIQISTVSVGGETEQEDVKPFTEQQFAIGQILENAYVRSKYEAEQHVLEAMEGGLSAKIIRVGNLMGRFSDGKFQINGETNGFMRRLRGYAALGKMPISVVDEQVEFTPIDLVAKAVLVCAETSPSYTVFHAYHPQKVYMADVMEVLAECGHSVEMVSDEVFEEELEKGIGDEEQNGKYMGLISYMQLGKAAKRREIPAENIFTTRLLLQHGFRWGIVDKEYLRKLLGEVWK